MIEAPLSGFQQTNIPIQSGTGKLDPIRQLLGDAWTLYKERFPVLPALLAIPYAFLFAGKIFSVGVVFTLIGLVFMLPVFAAMVFAISTGTGFLASFQQGMRVFLPLLWVGILVELVVMGGAVMFIIPAILMSIWFSLSVFTFTIEGKRGLNALLQSREYVKEFWWAIFGRMFLVGLILLIALIPAGILSFLVGLLFGKTVGTLVYYVSILLVGPFSMICSFKIYQNLTVLKPTLAAANPSSGRGFLIASAVIGLLLPIIIAIIFGAATLFLLRGVHTNSTTMASSTAVTSTPFDTLASTYNSFNASSSSAYWSEKTISFPLAKLSVMVPSIFNITGTPQLGFVYIGENGDSLILPFVNIETSKRDLSDEVTYTKKLLSSQGIPLTEATTTFEGYPAHVISITNYGWDRQFTIVQANGFVLDVFKFYMSDSRLNAQGLTSQNIQLVDMENKIIDEIISSIKIL